MKKILLVAIVVIAVCLLALPACGGTGPSGEPVTNVEDAVGVWHRTKKWKKALPEIYMQLRADGTIGMARVPDKWDYEWMSLDFAFDGARVSVTETGWELWTGQAQDFSCIGAAEPTGSYEIELLTNGNLKFVNAQDNCQYRREIFTLAEWEPVQ